MRDKIVILVDFDGTCVKHEYPKVGEEIGAPEVLRELVAAGHKLVLSTMRGTTSGLEDAVDWFVKHSIKLYGVQSNPTQRQWTDSPKPYGQLNIDDICLGIPLVYPDDARYIAGKVKIYDRPYVDWVAVRKLLVELGHIEEVPSKAGYNLFLDDLRDPSCLEEFLPSQLFSIVKGIKWEVVRDYWDFVEIINKRGLPNIISFDHDLGFNVCPDTGTHIELNGMDCVKYLVEFCIDNQLEAPKYLIHSKNEVGAGNMGSYLENFKKFTLKDKE